MKREGSPMGYTASPTPPPQQSGQSPQVFALDTSSSSIANVPLTCSLGPVVFSTRVLRDAGSAKSCMCGVIVDCGVCVVHIQ